MTLQMQIHRRRVSACLRHPAEPLTGICASCLRERLSRFDPAARSENSGDGGGGDRGTSQRNEDASLLSELRRSRSFSGGKCGDSCVSVERRRKSCDARVRNTLWYLFNLDDEKTVMNGRVEVETRHLGFSGVSGTVFESTKEVQNEEEIRVSEDLLIPEANVSDRRFEGVGEGELLTMKEHIDLEWQSKKHSGRDLKDIAGSVWVAATVVSEKLLKWRKMKKIKKIRRDSRVDGGDLAAMQVEKPIRRQLRDTQSEIADYGCGRRSCDTDPRFSVDCGRMSLDVPRYLFDAPRASWDGCLIGRTLPQLPPVGTLDEQVTVPVRGLDGRIPVDESMNSMKTPSHHSNSLSFRKERRNFDRSSSNRKMPVVEDEVKSVSNAKVSPATVEVFHGTKLLTTDRFVKESNPKYPQDECLEGFGSASRDCASVENGGNIKEFKKTSRWQKPWTACSLMHRRFDCKCRDEDRCTRGNIVDLPVQESQKKLGTEHNREGEGAFDRMLLRSNSSVGSRNPCKTAGVFQQMSSGGETKGYGKKRDFMLERNRSAGYSPNDLDNGLLRFYLTPLRSFRKSKSGRSRVKDSRSIARNILRI